MEELWRPNEKYIGVCVKCGREGMKRNMITLYTRDGPYSPARTLCHICRKCMPRLLDELEVGMPE